MNKKIVLTLFFLLLIIDYSFGQNDFRSGFIINLDNDTIQGQLAYRSNLKNYESCVFVDKHGEKEFLPNQIFGFGYENDKFFSSQIIKNAFVEVLVEGAISLYLSKDKFYVKKDTSIFELESILVRAERGGKVGYEEKSRWRGIVNYLTNDCSQNSFNEIAKLKLEEKSLTKFIVNYNKCKGSEFTEYKIDKPWSKLEFGATLGICSSQITTETSGAFGYLDDTYRSTDLTIGVLIAIFSPRIAEKIAFQGEFHFLTSSYSSLVILEETSTNYHDTFISLTTLSFPISLKYSLPERKYGSYVQGGINYDYHLMSNTKLLSEHVFGNVVNTFPARPAFEVNENQIGYWIGMGIYKSYPKFKGSIAIRYFQMSQLNKSKGFTANTNRISLNLIISKK